MPATLSVEEVLNIHLALVDHFAIARDPIIPSGVRSIGLLESAVFRQNIALGGILKYPEPRFNAATLLYGICMDHPFYNGNKRTAFVAALVHLDRNGYIPVGVDQTEFGNLLIAIADHRLTTAASRYRRDRAPERTIRRHLAISSDEEVAIIAEWLKRRTRLEDKREHPLTFRQLKRILSRFSCRLGEPHNNFVDVYISEQYEETGFLGLGKPRIKTRESKVTQVSYGGENELLTVSSIKMIRKYCRLLAQNGIDSRAFYDEEAKVDYILNQYRTLLTRLARA